MSERITVADIKRKVDYINQTYVPGPKISLETYNPGDGRRYAIEVSGHGARLHSSASARECWEFLRGLEWGLLDWHSLKRYNQS